MIARAHHVQNMHRRRGSILYPEGAPLPRQPPPLQLLTPKLPADLSKLRFAAVQRSPASSEGAPASSLASPPVDATQRAARINQREH